MSDSDKKVLSERKKLVKARLFVRSFEKEKIKSDSPTIYMNLILKLILQCKR